MLLHLDGRTSLRIDITNKPQAKPVSLFPVDFFFTKKYTFGELNSTVKAMVFPTQHKPLQHSGIM